MLGQILSVAGLKPTEIAYNPAVIIQDGQKIIAARVESRDSTWHDPDQYDPHIMFYQRAGDSLHLLPRSPVFVRYEDPWATWLTTSVGTRQLLFGAVWVDYSVSPPVITTRIFLAPSVQELDPFSPVVEIRGMKDVRLCQLPDGRLAVFTRPQFDDMFFGRIGFIIIDDLADLTSAVPQAALLKIDMDSSGKIGANEVLYYQNRLQVICHVATLGSARDLHYRAFHFSLDPDSPFTGQIHLSPLCCRSDFPTSLPKADYLEDVVFPGGIGSPQEQEFYCGLSDSSLGVFPWSVPLAPAG